MNIRAAFADDTVVMDTFLTNSGRNAVTMQTKLLRQNLKLRNSRK